MRHVVMRQQRTIVTECQVQAALFNLAPHIAAREGQDDPGEPLGLPALHEHDVLGVEAAVQKRDRLMDGPDMMHVIITHPGRPCPDTIPVELRAYEQCQVGDLRDLFPDRLIPMPLRRWRHVEVAQNRDPPPCRHVPEGVERPAIGDYGGL